MTDIISVGEILIDLTQTGTEAGISRFAANPGGAPANVAVAAARLGASTAMIGKVGCDPFGASLREMLRGNGVSDAGLFEAPDAPTTMAVVCVDARGDRSFSFYRDGCADLRLTAQEALGAIPEELKFLHFGSLSLTASPARGAALAAVEHAKKLGARISYDPNYRPSLWPDEETACFWMKYPLSQVDVLKVSEEELPLLTQTEDLETGTLRLAELGISLVMVTLGERGVFYRFGGQTGHVDGVRTTVADTNGAGDTFLGAVLSRLCARPNGVLEQLSVQELEEILLFANRAAAVTCSRSGAIPAMPTLRELD